MINTALMMLTTARCYNILPKTATIWHLRKQSYRCRLRRRRYLAICACVKSKALNFFIVRYSYPLPPRPIAATTNGTSGMPAIPMSTATVTVAVSSTTVVVQVACFLVTPIFLYGKSSFYGHCLQFGFLRFVSGLPSSSGPHKPQLAFHRPLHS